MSLTFTNDYNLFDNYVFTDCPADGSCFYHSIAAHPRIKHQTGDDVRRNIFENSLKHQNVFEKLMVYDTGNFSFEEFVNIHK
jgi:hypothetical protein